jgi:hypothetical protein
MPKKRFSPEQIIATLRQIEVKLSQGRSCPSSVCLMGLDVRDLRIDVGEHELDVADLDRHGEFGERTRAALGALWSIMSRVGAAACLPARQTGKRQSHPQLLR